MTFGIFFTETFDSDIIADLRRFSSDNTGKRNKVGHRLQLTDLYRQKIVSLSILLFK